MSAQRKIRIPQGYLLLSEKYFGTSFGTNLSKVAKLTYSDDLGVIDMCPSEHCCMIYLSEPDAGNNDWKRKAALLKTKAPAMRAIILCVRSPTMEYFFIAVQKHVVMTLGLTLIPVSGESDIPPIIEQIMNAEIKKDKNLFLRKPESKVTEDQRNLTILQLIPGLGKKKTKLLLDTFGNISRICAASREELEKLLGKAGAESVRRFFDEPATD